MLRPGRSRAGGLHPCAETLKTPTSQVVHQWGLLRSSPHWRTARLDRLELGGRAVGQRRVQALAIVDLLDESADRRLCRGEVAIGAAVDLLLLQGSHEALRHGVVVGTACPAHARLDAMRGQPGDIVAAGVLDAAV